MTTNISKCMGCKCFFEGPKAITITYRNTPQDFCSVDCARIWLDEIERIMETFSDFDFLVMRWKDLQDMARHTTADGTYTDEIYYELCHVMSEMNEYPAVYSLSYYSVELERKLEKFIGRVGE